jgi:hypothetical protein
MPLTKVIFVWPDSMNLGQNAGKDWIMGTNSQGWLLSSIV